MINTVKTETIINGQVFEVISNLETEKNSEKLEDVSIKVNELLTSYLSKENDDSNESSQDECENQNNEDIKEDLYLDTNNKSTKSNKNKNESDAVEQLGTSSGKKHRIDAGEK
ncbi:uncharacterized protein cubi_01987 [Cryptosporidium ubiquitum]|uniref:Uncharacterized protein n=1 Tax=Cryptosporidium ubiquitum TaxID=857276 RepID=A0A1J4MMH7_9CRYT|nr:uncharacterized protein cubi_01987 [Cryptosporidium ubiquitum]OII75466.1 hypothetical protein cubi_01987 [Cryptosporidium ubiquitum]